MPGSLSHCVLGKAFGTDPILSDRDREIQPVTPSVVLDLLRCSRCHEDGPIRLYELAACPRPPTVLLVWGSLHEQALAQPLDSRGVSGCQSRANSLRSRPRVRPST